MLLILLEIGGSGDGGSGDCDGDDSGECSSGNVLVIVG